jgi:hypothetical protein
VERSVVEGERLCVRGPDLGLEAFEREPSAYELDGMLGEVDTVAIAPARTKRMKSVPRPMPISSNRLPRAPSKSAKR